MKRRLNIWLFLEPLYETLSVSHAAVVLDSVCYHKASWLILSTNYSKHVTPYWSKNSATCICLLLWSLLQFGCSLLSGVHLMFFDVQNFVLNRCKGKACTFFVNSSQVNCYSSVDIFEKFKHCKFFCLDVPRNNTHQMCLRQKYLFVK